MAIFHDARLLHAVHIIGSFGSCSYKLLHLIIILKSYKSAGSISLLDASEF